MGTPHNVLAISYGRHLFEERNNERARMIACAKEFDSLHIIVFSRDVHGLGNQSIDDKLFLHPTQSTSRIGMIIDALRIAKRIILSKKRDSWIVSAQDPVEAGLIGYMLKRMYRVRLNIQMHGDFLSEHWARERPWNRLRRHMSIHIIKRADCIRVVSARIKKKLTALGVSKSRIFVLPIAIDITKFRSAHTADDIKKRYKGALLILAAGRFVREKNFFMLLDAFYGAHKEHPHTKLLLVGSGPLEAELRARIKHNTMTDSVSILSWTDDMPALMKSVDIYALSSNHEGWGRVLIEAMASGLPIVTTDVGCVGEILIDKKHGEVVSVGDTSAFKSTLMRLIENKALRKKYGVEGQVATRSYTLTHAAYAKKWAASLRACMGTR